LTRADVLLEYVSFFLGGKKCLDLNLLHFFVNWVWIFRLSAARRLILLVEKDQQVLQMGKTITITITITITKRNICIHMHWEVALDLSVIVPLNNLCCATLSFLITLMFTIFWHFLPPRKKLTESNDKHL
jgi:hypothetical protein